MVMNWESNIQFMETLENVRELPEQYVLVKLYYKSGICLPGDAGDDGDGAGDNHRDHSCVL